jgi:ABC-type sulfate transport system substrate-binding protein
MKLFPITDLAANWDEVHEKFFAEGAIFDSIYKR